MRTGRIVSASLALSVALGLSSCTTTVPERSQVRSIKGAVDVPVGVAIDVRGTAGDAASVVSAEFDQITAENDMKPEAWYDDDAQFRFGPGAKKITDFAVAHGMSVYGHTLVWYKQNPEWFFLDDEGGELTGSASDEAFLTERLRTHIFAVAESFHNVYGDFGTDGNPIVAFDVVNEAISDANDDAAGLRDSSWERILGEDYIDLAFEFADEAFNDRFAAPDADRPVALFINDYDTEFEGKRDRLHSLVERLLDRGVPVDGVGHQFHTRLSTDVDDLGAALAAFDDLDVLQAVTELDVATGIPADNAALDEQGDYYRDAFRIFRERDDPLFSVSLWGLSDDRSWRADEGAPLLFGSGLTKKPAYFGVIDSAE